MDMRTVGTITAVINGLFWFANLGLLIWVAVKARSSGKLLTIIGMAVGLTTVLVGLLSTLLYNSLGMGPEVLLIGPMLAGIIGLLANFLRTKAFLNIDPKAAQVEGGFNPDGWRSGQPGAVGPGTPPAGRPGPAASGQYGQQAARQPQPSQQPQQPQPSQPLNQPRASEYGQQPGQPTPQSGPGGQQPPAPPRGPGSYGQTPGNWQIPPGPPKN